ncbi:MAG: winged helix-turn-helix domain-containing protein [Conexivisphaerales archaeon]
MNRLDKEILKALAFESLTVYSLAQKVGKPFPTVLRHVKRLLQEGYIAKSQGKRRAWVLNLTPKGLVMLVFEGDIGKYWATSKDVEESFEEFLKMLGEVVRRSKGGSYEG